MLDKDFVKFMESTDEITKREFPEIFSRLKELRVIGEGEYQAAVAADDRKKFIREFAFRFVGHGMDLTSAVARSEDCSEKMILLAKLSAMNSEVAPFSVSFLKGGAVHTYSQTATTSSC